MSGSCAASDTLIGYGTASNWCPAQRSRAHAIRQRVRNLHPSHRFDTAHRRCTSKALTRVALGPMCVQHQEDPDPCSLSALPSTCTLGHSGAASSKPAPPSLPRPLPEILRSPSVVARRAAHLCADGSGIQARSAAVPASWHPSMACQRGLRAEAALTAWQTAATCSTSCLPPRTHPSMVTRTMTRLLLGRHPREVLPVAAPWGLTKMHDLLCCRRC